MYTLTVYNVGRKSALVFRWLMNTEYKYDIDSASDSVS